MKRKIELVMTVLLLVGVIVASQKLSQYVSSGNVEAKEKGKTIMVDPGHGGSDPGKVGVHKELEKDLNLQIAQKVKKMLESKGYTVVMTRDTDQGLYDGDATNKKISDMKKRVELINKQQPALVISIHQNSYHESSIKGAQVFYYSHSKEGEKAAKVMQEALLTIDAKNNRQAKANDTYYLLKKTKVPTIIVESGFLSNSEEAMKLVTEEYQEQVAKAICDGVLKYMDKKKK